MKRLEEVTRYANATIEPELKKKEVEAYKRLLKIHRAFDLERRMESEKKERLWHVEEIIV